ncbi:uncharacterized protein V1513DRAFT_426411 [Lipomyces chichibuensis]|uniref:uncharacterized protein n=1 Tax=Lipomyces chichibuensis TaxID=1546026 RepID=UPI0033430065
MGESSQGTDASSASLQQAPPQISFARMRRRPRALSYPLVPVDLQFQPHSYASSTSLASYLSGGQASPPVGDASSVLSYGSGSRRRLAGGFGSVFTSYGDDIDDEDEENEHDDDDDDATSSTSSYAGSDAETVEETEEFSASEYVTDKILQAFDAMLLDRAVVVQAQSSGLLNAKARELHQLQELATTRLQQTRISYTEGMKVVREVQKDLKWVQRHVDVLKKKISAKHPEEYSEARELIPEIIERED